MDVVTHTVHNAVRTGLKMRIDMAVSHIPIYSVHHDEWYMVQGLYTIILGARVTGTAAQQARQGPSPPPPPLSLSHLLTLCAVVIRILFAANAAHNL